MPPGGGTETNRPGYHQRYWGLEFSATKRHVEPLDGAVRVLDQRLARILRRSGAIDHRSDAGAGAAHRRRPFAGPQVDGGLVVRKSAGSGKSDIYMVAPKYQIIANGLL